MAISIHGLGDLGKYNSRPLITYEGIIRFIKPYLRELQETRGHLAPVYIIYIWNSTNYKID